MTSQQRDILLDVNGQTVNHGSNWYTDAILSDGVAEVLVSVLGNTQNFSVYVIHNTSSGTASDITPITVTTVSLPAGYSTYYVARATVQLDSDNFQVAVFNTDTSVNASFNASVRVFSRSAS